MSLLDAVTAALPDLRTQAEALMVDSIRFAEPGTETFENGTYVTTPGATIYEGPCQVQVTDTVPRDATVGETEIAVERIVIKVPWDADPIPVNSVGEITAVSAVSGVVVGTRYRVIGSHDKTFQTASRYPAELVTS